MTGSGPRSLDAAVLSYERTWREQPPGPLAESLRQASPELVRELVLIDLERRYRSERGSLNDELGNQPRLDDYVRVLANTGIEFVPSAADLAEEYRVRTIWGDQPRYGRFCIRFPQHAEQLGVLLPATDRELQLEVPLASTRKVRFDERAPLRHEDFEILQMLGSGATGKVYRARQKSLHRMVAIKALHKRLQFEGWAVDAFLRESKVLASLNHPNVAQVFGVGRFPGGGFFQVMTLVEGTSLRQRLASSESVSFMELRAILRDIANGIAHAHSQGVVHCDLKPENVVLSRDRAVVIDFGMAHVIPFESFGGTPVYSSPEVISGDGITFAADIWSIGQIWRELLNRESKTKMATDAGDLLDRCLSEIPSCRPSIEEILAWTLDA